MVNHCSQNSSDDDSEILWKAANPNLTALQDIISAHFRLPCCRYAPLGGGSYARIFLFTLEDGQQVVGRIILPVRETVKTEAEVASMVYVRGTVRHYSTTISTTYIIFHLACTRIPVPQVYLYCSTQKNPVGAEWILMEYMQGRPLGDCFDDLTYPQKIRVGMDLALVMSSLFKIKASQCGSLSRIRRRNSIGGLKKPLHAQSYPIDAADTLSHLGGLSDPAIIHHGFYVGPLNDITFLSYPHQIPPQHCGPFDSERQFLEAFAFLGYPPTRADDKLSRWGFEKALEVYDVVAALYRQSETFHFAHGDLSEGNILIDPDTGVITGIVDWEMAGFRPAWLSAVAAGWFNDDSECFFMNEYQGGRGNYGDDPTDALVRAHFRLKLAELDEELFRHHLQGIEQRAFFYACCHEYSSNTELWLKKYGDHGWPTGRRGPFPFD